MVCKECITGSIHQGHPKGREETIFGLPSYVTDPPEGQDIKSIIVIIPDALGWVFVNTRLLADSYAKRTNSRVYVPEFMDNHWIGPDKMDSMDSLMKPASSWLGSAMKIFSVMSLASAMGSFIFFNRLSVRKPVVFKWFQELRASEEGMRLPIGTAGFCWGGLYVVLLCHDEEKANGRSLIDVGYTAHPSALTIPQDIEKVQQPLSIIIGDKDFIMPIAQVEQADKILKEKDQPGRYEVTVIKGARHGFATRGDLEKEAEGQQAKQAEEQAVAWFSNWLGKSVQ